MLSFCEFVFPHFGCCIPMCARTIPTDTTAMAHAYLRQQLQRVEHRLQTTVELVAEHHRHWQLLSSTATLAECLDSLHRLQHGHMARYKEHHQTTTEAQHPFSKQQQHHHHQTTPGPMALRDASLLSPRVVSSSSLPHDNNHHIAHATSVRSAAQFIANSKQQQQQRSPSHTNNDTNKPPPTRHWNRLDPLVETDHETDADTTPRTTTTTDRCDTITPLAAAAAAAVHWSLHSSGTQSPPSALSHPYPHSIINNNDATPTTIRSLVVDHEQPWLRGASSTALPIQQRHHADPARTIPRPWSLSLQCPDRLAPALDAEPDVASAASSNLLLLLSVDDDSHGSDDNDEYDDNDTVPTVLQSHHGQRLPVEQQQHGSMPQFLSRDKENDRPLLPTATDDDSVLPNKMNGDPKWTTTAAAATIHSMYAAADPDDYSIPSVTTVLHNPWNRTAPTTISDACWESTNNNNNNTNFRTATTAAAVTVPSPSNYPGRERRFPEDPDLAEQRAFLDPDDERFSFVPSEPRFYSQDFFDDGISVLDSTIIQDIAPIVCRVANCEEGRCSVGTTETPVLDRYRLASDDLSPHGFVVLPNPRNQNSTSHRTKKQQHATRSSTPSSLLLSHNRVASNTMPSLTDKGDGRGRLQTISERILGAINIPSSQQTPLKTSLTNDATRLKNSARDSFADPAILLRYIPRAEYDEAPRLVHLQTTFDELQSAVTLLNAHMQFTSWGDDRRFIQNSEAHRILAESFPLERKRNSVLFALSFCQRVRMRLPTRREDEIVYDVVVD